MDEKTLIYYQLFEKLINAMTSGARFNRQEFVDILSEICELFHIAKGVTEFYTSLSQEKAGQGEILIDYDNGRGDKVLRLNSRRPRRMWSSRISNVWCTVYRRRESIALWTISASGIHR